jgi:hypothetical protein
MSRSGGDYRRGLHWEWIYWPLFIPQRLGTTSNYSATANLHNSQITTAPAKTFPACCVFTGRFLTPASNSGDSSASGLRSSLHSLPCRTQFSDRSGSSLITFRHGPHRKHSSIFACLLRALLRTDRCPPSHRLAAVTCLPLPRNGSTR